MELSTANPNTTQNRLFNPIFENDPRMRAFDFALVAETSRLYASRSNTNLIFPSVVRHFQYHGLELSQIFARSINSPRFHSFIFNI